MIVASLSLAPLLGTSSHRVKKKDIAVIINLQSVLSFPLFSTSEFGFNFCAIGLTIEASAGLKPRPGVCDVCLSVTSGEFEPLAGSLWSPVCFVVDCVGEC